MIETPSSPEPPDSRGIDRGIASYWPRSLKVLELLQICVAPGAVATDMFFEGRTEEMVRKVLGMIPGEVIRVNGGFV
ncbi:unnamed protein product [Ilex paraguariensis]|uniref:Uncharacterized protein n=1 Tax=Ilex paraguariensis TaxID=185542 RepID=A0ABC8SEX3_9AQUA